MASHNYLKTKIKYQRNCEKCFFLKPCCSQRVKLMNNAVFRKTMENVRKHIDIKLVTIVARRNYLLPEPNYHTTKFFSKNLLAIKSRKTKIFINKLGLF